LQTLAKVCLPKILLSSARHSLALAHLSFSEPARHHQDRITELRKEFEDLEGSANAWVVLLLTGGQFIDILAVALANRKAIRSEFSSAWFTWSFSVRCPPFIVKRHPLYQVCKHLHSDGCRVPCPSCLPASLSVVSGDYRITFLYILYTLLAIRRQLVYWA
jgi:hypothetical protein